MPPPVRADVFYIKGAPRRFLLSYDRLTLNGAAYSRLMNGNTSGQLGPKCEERLKAITFILVVAFCVSPQDKGKSENDFIIQEAAHMLNMKKIEELQNVDIGAVDKNSLADVSRIKLDHSLPKDKRMARILRATKNPYCFRYEDTAVKIEFADNAPPLQDTMQGFLIRQKSGF